MNLIAPRPDSPRGAAPPPESLAFVGGGNMATAIIGGLVRSGRSPDAILVIDPGESQRTRLQADFGVRTLAQAGPALATAATVVWAVKPQYFAAAAEPCAPHVGSALHLSVMAGIRSAAIARACRTGRVVRAMPNTPALIGQGITGLFALEAVTADDRANVEAVLLPTGRVLWTEDEAALNAVTALSGSGPAYVFYFIEAMTDAAVDLGLSPEQGRALALATFAGATALASQSTEAPEALRERVTSKGGTTHAAISTLQARDVKAAIVDAVRAAHRRAIELGNEFGA